MKTPGMRFVHVVANTGVRIAQPVSTSRCRRAEH